MTEGVRVERYELTSLVSSRGSVHLWLAYDPALDRAVGIRLVPLSDPRADAMAEAARRAATVDERRLVGILDVLPRVTVHEPDGQSPSSPVPCLAVVHEWIEGQTLADILEDRAGEPLAAADALPLVRQVAIAIANSHAQGVHHGRLRPGSLLIEASGDDHTLLPWGTGEGAGLVGDIDAVRIRGLATDATLYPPDDRADDTADLPPVDVDIHGIGCLLYATVTGRWPGGLADGMSPAPTASGRLLPPTQVVADVPPMIDEICARSIDPRVSGDWPPKRGRTPYADIDALVTALSVATERVTAVRPARRGRREDVDPGAPRGPLSTGQRIGRGFARLAAAVIALVLVGGLAMFGVRVASSSASPWGLNPTPVPSNVLTETADPDATAALAPGVLPGEIVPVAAQAHDPFGDGSEGTDSADLSFDGKQDTAWTTDQYWSEDLDGKPGVGLVLDLGVQQNVSAVRLELIGNGSSVQVRVATTLLRKPSAWTLLAQAESIGTSIDLRSPRPVIGRYVLIWFTHLPLTDGVYQGGLRDVTVFS